LIRARSIVERVAMLALPARDREFIAADLREGISASGAPFRSGRMLRQALGIAARFHGECYRHSDDRLRIATLLAGGMALLWVVPLATSQGSGGATEVFVDPASRLIVKVWTAAHLTSAAAAGLLVGRVTLLPEHAQLSRWHIGVALGMASMAAHGASRGVVAALLLLGAVWLGSQGRRAVESSPTDPVT